MSNLKNTTQTWGKVSIYIHWITAITVICLFAVGLWMEDLSYYHEWYHKAPFLHKSVGICLLILTTFRLLWRVSGAIPESIASHSKFEKFAAKSAHIMLYLLLFGIMISGYLISTSKGQPISVFDLFEVPATITSIENQSKIAGKIHFFLAWGIIILASLHAIAAIKHHFVDKDKTLVRMLSIK